MRTQQLQWTQEGWSEAPNGLTPRLVLVFGARAVLEDDDRLRDLRARWPGARFAGCSTAGEIHGVQVSDGSLVATAVEFDSTRVAIACVSHGPEDDSEAAGRDLVEKLPGEGLRHVLVLSDGTNVNGTALVKGMRSKLPNNVQVTGGLAGDGADFERTATLDDEDVHERVLTSHAGAVTAVGLYGDALHVGYGSLGGWDPFGPQRRVTRSEGNVLYELDGQPALALYKKYLGDQAADLPASGLLFPLSVGLPGREREVVRTILAVDEKEQSLTFAGDVPEGATARLMKANFDRLVEGASGAARRSSDRLSGAELAILISCVGRKLVLKQRVEEELEAVRDVLGDQATMAGFYSYGEICPAAPDADCELHNQTMTITTLREQ